MTALVIAVLACAFWGYLIGARGRFWLCEENDDLPATNLPAPRQWPGVVAVIPARNEADAIGDAVRSLLRQRYEGNLSIIVVDDNSDDGTCEAARAAATAERATPRLTVLTAPPLPAGWIGKVWAQTQALAHLRAQQQEPEFILLTDADIVCSPEALGTLVARAEYEGLVLSSRMAALHCVSNAERLLIPAFVFFFQMIYPFRWVNDSRYRIAAAAGGCMLVRRAALERAGGLGSIRGEIIDDCALARRLKVQGPIRLALTRQVRSQRPYASTGDIGRMIARTAYAQLRYSPLLLTGTLLVMGIGYLAPPIITVCGALPAILGASAWAAMTFAFRPTLRLYDRALWWGLLLPAIAFVYVAFTIRSAHLHVRGRGGLWKGRTYG